MARSAIRRGLAILAMVVALVVANAANLRYADLLREGQATFDLAGVVWLTGVLPLVAAATGLGLGWLVLRGPRPDPLVGITYAIAGVIVVFAPAAWMHAGWSLPNWLPVSDLLSGLELALWEAAAVAVIGLAELLRWVRSRGTASGGPT